MNLWKMIYLLVALVFLVAIPVAKVQAGSCNAPNSSLNSEISSTQNAILTITPDAQNSLIMTIPTNTHAIMTDPSGSVVSHGTVGTSITADGPLWDTTVTMVYNPELAENVLINNALYVGTRDGQHYFHSATSANVKYVWYDDSHTIRPELYPLTVGVSVSIDKSTLENYSGTGRLPATLHLLSWFHYQERTDLTNVEDLLGGLKVIYSYWRGQPDHVGVGEGTFLVKNNNIYSTCELSIDQASAIALKAGMPIIEHDLPLPLTQGEVKSSIETDSKCGKPSIKNIVNWIPCFITEISYRFFYAIMGWNLT